MNKKKLLVGERDREKKLDERRSKATVELERDHYEWWMLWKMPSNEARPEVLPHWLGMHVGQSEKGENEKSDEESRKRVGRVSVERDELQVCIFFRRLMKREAWRRAKRGGHGKCKVKMTKKWIVGSHEANAEKQSSRMGSEPVARKEWSESGERWMLLVTKWVKRPNGPSACFVRRRRLWIRIARRREPTRTESSVLKCLWKGQTRLERVTDCHAFRTLCSNVDR